MKTLIIHPEDPSTTFLDIVYTPIKDKTIVDGGISKTELMGLIREHDRVSSDKFMETAEKFIQDICNEYIFENEISKPAVNNKNATPISESA